MDEGSPEHRQGSPEVHMGGDCVPPRTLREELIDLYPKRCRNGDGSCLSIGRVCNRILTSVDEAMEGVVAERVTEAEARAIAEADADYVDKVCATGPRYFPATTTLLKCGIKYDNFYPLPPNRTTI